jgi:hypothetical protein
MRKYFLGLFSLALAICFNVLQSNKPITDELDQTTFNWYPVNASNQIQSTTPKYSSMTKAAVISVDPCKDNVLPNCLYGTNGSVTVGQDISSEPSNQRILKQN